MTMDQSHTLALVSLTGSFLNVLGALYLAYDLLGGEHGPLRTLTRAVTYGTLFGGGYALALGPLFGLLTGVAHGITLGWEFSLASKGRPKPSFWQDVATSAFRGLAFALGAAYLFGILFGVVFGLLSTVGQVLGYRAGIRPTMDYQPATRPRLTKNQALSAVNRVFGYGFAGFVSSLVAHQRASALSVGLRLGASVGILTAVVVACTPFVEWIADHMPEKRMGVLGIALILTGFTLQSFQYWVALLS